LVIAPFALPLTRPVSAVSIKKILNLNDPVEPSENDDIASNGLSAPSAPISKDGTPVWKLLVFDVSNPARTGGAPLRTFNHGVQIWGTKHPLARARADLVPDRILVAM
jgi:hypothetical protein